MDGRVGASNRFIAILSGLLPLATAAAVLFVLIVVGGKAIQGYEMRQEARALEARIDELKREYRRLNEELEYYRSDVYIEKVAREELGLVRPGDVAVVVISPEGRRSSSSLLPTPTPAPTAVPERDVPTWQRWLSLFVGQD